MSCSICRIAKVKSGGVGGIHIHDNREKDGISHTNQDIDWTKTHENVSLIEQKKHFKTAVRERIAELELKRQPRSDATVMCQCLITSDKAFFDEMSREEQNEYFKQSLDFIKERYGDRNIISATIHYDERTPHMHVNFVPVTADGRLSAKDLFSPQSLRTLQDDYNRYVRERGHDLDRGKIGSKTKHLDVEQYKVETRYAELEGKKRELEQLEQVDKTVHLRADKGKLMYSTKQVDAIKTQNQALRLENYHKGREIEELERNVTSGARRLLKAQEALKGTEIPLERLKDLESENRALQDYRSHHPQLDTAMKPFDEMKEKAKTLGDKMVEAKTLYHSCLEQREQLIKLSGSYERQAQECARKAADLSGLQERISDSIARENALKGELEGLQGIFKGKARKECQKHLEQQEQATARLVNQLQADHGITPDQIPQKLTDYHAQRAGFISDKGEAMARTTAVEQIRDSAVHSYKFHKGMSDTQNKNLAEISDRISEKVPLRYGEDKIFRLTQEDRSQLLKEYKGKGMDSKMLERCKNNFDKQNIQERKERELARSKPRTQYRNRDYGYER